MLNQLSDIEIVAGKERGKNVLRIKEGLPKDLPLNSASEGLLRLIAYNAINHQPNMPSLVALEEPELNLHPKMMQHVADLLVSISKQTQVIFTTHSSQLLDCLELEQLGKNLEILLLNKSAQRGTQVKSLSGLRNDKPAVKSWMVDFGIGSTIFHSSLLDDYIGA